jgi:hypothetical protein
MRSRVQQVAVRVIASELDRRSAKTERALRDFQSQLAGVHSAQLVLSAQIEATNDHLRRVHEHLKNVETVQARLDRLTATRLDTAESVGVTTQQTVGSLGVELAGVREAIARLDALVQQR